MPSKSVVIPSSWLMGLSMLKKIIDPPPPLMAPSESLQLDWHENALLSIPSVKRITHLEIVCSEYKSNDEQRVASQHSLQCWREEKYV